MTMTFVLRAPEHARSMLDYVKAHAGAQAAAGRPLVVEVSEYTAKRSDAANRRYWAMLEEIAEQAVIEGKCFSRDVWHEAMKDQFAPKQEGPRGLVAMSTSQMTKQQFGEYMEKIEAYAVQTLGVEFAYV